MENFTEVTSKNQAALERRRHRLAVSKQQSWHGTAFLAEALLLLGILAISVAVFMQLFAQAHDLGTRDAALGSAVQIASNEAEAFETNPTAGDAITEVNGFDVERTVKAETTKAGTLYRATITVTEKDSPEGVSGDADTSYTITTSKYVSGVR